RRVRRDRVRDDSGLKALMESAPGCVLDADLSDGTGDEDGVHGVRDQKIGQPSAMEPVVAVLVDLGLTGMRRELIDHGHAVALALDVAIATHVSGPAA